MYQKILIPSVVRIHMSLLATRSAAHLSLAIRTQSPFAFYLNTKDIIDFANHSAQYKCFLATD